MSDTSGSRLQVLFDTAVQSYEKHTGMKLIDHPLAKQLEDCHSVDSIMDILQHQGRVFTEFRGDSSKLMNHSSEQSMFSMLFPQVQLLARVLVWYVGCRF